MVAIAEVVFVVLALVAPTYADGKTKPAISIGAPRSKTSLDGAKLELFPDTERTRAVLTLTLSSAATSRRLSRDDELELLLPDGARVVGLALAVGGRQRLVGKPDFGACGGSDCIEHRVWQTYVDLKHKKLDAALVEFGYVRDGVGHYTVHVSPLLNGEPHVAEIEIELPPGRQLDIQSGSAVADYTLEIDGVAQQVKPLPAKHKRVRIALPKPKPHDSAAVQLIPRVAVDKGISLIVDPTSANATP